jgi:hypothetical protein
MRALTKTSAPAGGAGLCPAGAAIALHELAARKEGAHGGTMGSPMFEKTGRYQSPDHFTLD